METLAEEATAHTKEDRPSVPRNVDQITITRTFDTLVRCPISTMLMHNPVVADDGYIYEKVVLEDYRSQSTQESPITRQNMSNTMRPVPLFTKIRDLFVEINPDLKEDILLPDFTFENNVNTIYGILGSDNHDPILQYTGFQLGHNGGGMPILSYLLQKCKSFNIIKHVFDNSTDFNATFSNGWKVIHYVCNYSVPTVILYVFNKADPKDLTTKTDDGKTPLSICMSRQADAAIFDALATHGIVPDFKFENNVDLINTIIQNGNYSALLKYTGFQLSCKISYNTFLPNLLSRCNTFEIIKHVLDNSTDFNEYKEPPGDWKVIHYVCHCCGPETIRYVMNKVKPSDLTNKTKDGHTPLSMYMSRQKDMALLDDFKAKGVIMDFTFNNNVALIIKAVSSGNSNMLLKYTGFTLSHKVNGSNTLFLTYLLSGCKTFEVIKHVFDNSTDFDKLIESTNNYKVIHYVCSNSTSDVIRYVISRTSLDDLLYKTTDHQTAFSMCVSKYDDPTLLDLLIAKGVTFESQRDIIISGHKLLEFAFAAGKRKTVEWLFSKYDIDMTTVTNGQTFLHQLCASGRNTQVIEQLIHKLDVSAFEIPNKLGERPIHLVIKYFPSTNLYKQLVEKGVDYTSETNDGSEPFHYACSFGTAPTIEYFLGLGVNIMKPVRQSGHVPMQLIEGNRNIPDNRRNDLINALCQMMEIYVLEQDMQQALNTSVKDQDQDMQQALNTSVKDQDQDQDMQQALNTSVKDQDQDQDQDMQQAPNASVKDQAQAPDNIDEHVKQALVFVNVL